MLISVKLLTKCVIIIYALGSVHTKFGVWIKGRGRSSGRVQGVRTPLWDDLRFSNATDILKKKKKKLCGLLLLTWSKRRVHPLLKKSWIRPWKAFQSRSKVEISGRARRKEFFGKLCHSVQSLKTLKQIREGNGMVSLTPEKLPNIKGDLVRIDLNDGVLGFR